MKLVDWSMQGLEFTNCSCNWGCSCQFNGPPSRGHCHAHVFIQVDQGHFGDVPLDGLRWGVLAAWPAAIHLGNGTFQSVIDEHTDSEWAASALYYLGEIDYKQENYEEARAKFKNFLIVYPHHELSGRAAKMLAKLDKNLVGTTKEN